MEQIPLAVSRRETTGKGAAKKMRAGGSVPAILYSGGKDAEKLAVQIADLDRVMRHVAGGTAFLSLSVGEDKPRMAVIKELQYDYLGTGVVHADFIEISADQELTIDVPLEIVGVPTGLGAGSMLAQIVYEVAVMGKVADIPDSLSLDVSELEIGDSLHAEDLDIPAGVRLENTENFQIISMQEVMEVEEEEPEEEEELEEGEEAPAEGEEKPAEEGETKTEESGE